MWDCSNAISAGNDNRKCNTACRCNVRNLGEFTSTVKRASCNRYRIELYEAFTCARAKRKKGKKNIKFIQRPS